MNYKKTAIDIIEQVGGSKNILDLEHCSTRLRFKLIDRSKVNQDALKKVQGVMSIVNGAQFQVVIGNSVVDVYDEILKVCPLDINDSTIKTGEKINLGARFIEFIINIFQPLIFAIAGAGILKSLLMLLAMFNILKSDSTIYTLLVAISDATFYFLPLMVAVTTANVLNCNRLVAIAAVGYLLLPATTTALSEGVELFGFTIPNIAYNAQVFPAILCVSFLAIMEKIFNKYSPKPIRTFFVPMMSLAITVPITLTILGPLGYNVGTIFTIIILFLYNKMGFLVVGLLAVVLPFMVATGMHKALIPYAINTIGKLGYEALYMTASLAHNISESGACFAVALRTKDETLKQTALSAGISALMGITEPALYGITLQHKRAILGVVLSSAISGTFLGLFTVKGFVLVGPGLASMSMFIDPNNGNNLIFAIIGFVVAILGSFIITLIIWKEDANTAESSTEDIVEEELIEEEKEVNILVSPVEGKVIDISKVNDELFASKTLGDGVAIIPANGNLYAPCDSGVVMLFETKHAIGLKTKNGAEILIHIGINTVSMNGDGFKTFVKTGDNVKEGDLLIKFDLDKISHANLDSTVMIVNNNGADYTYKVLNKSYGNVKKGSILFDVKGGI
ncbi:beta-glucoside-specific PTS transporter subunit IIABC [Clostridioides difficile]|uniref:beta-glucoside-specific PTS transporter subunit IIABC n=1 Tax=Clostridioides difficile TaxID=1496 RepID=UPI0008726A3A|nr:beta-glucoside-specific PTS transporter subunit IIABC [Clostridioides difficile]AXU48689.1 PTS system beta-glucoside-specific transporter subunit IIABC [Clostridioides difficile]EGT4909203.1 PTS beta-glucoside transporter subunit IIBCA [Clostridioides difficile]EGT5014433.1 PTS beta-glucoside transporter subunit IIBCA [Clostridioides difficile]MBS4863670.1 beta-glucoside-specific PTS transporter subunit IIABC [Clostridioides difficile]MCI4264455.1 beta-glucoside-specific PTS transporter sub